MKLLGWDRRILEQVQDPAGGGAEPSLSLTDDPGVQVAEEPPVIVTEGREWLEGVDQELLQERSLADIKDLNSLVKNYVHAQKMVGRNKIVVPDDHATKDDWNQIYDKLGRPEREKYEVKFGESKYTDEFKNGFLDKAHETGLLPHQAQEVFNYWNDQVASAQEAHSQELNEYRSQQVEKLKEDWGAGFDKQMKTAQIAFQTFTDEDTSKYLAESGLAEDPNLIRLFAKIGEQLNEDTFNRDAVRSLGITKDEASTKINEVMGNFDHPYWKSEHPGHKSAVAEMTKWQQISNS